LCQAQTTAAAVPEPQNRYFTRFSRSPPASSGCAQLICHKSACGRSGDQGSQGEPPQSLGGLYAAVGAPAQSYRGSTVIPWPLPPRHTLSTIFRQFSADVAVLPAASPFRGAAAAAFLLILRRAHRDAGNDNSRVSLLHASGGGRGLRDAYACVVVRRHVAWKLVQCLCAREASSPVASSPGLRGAKTCTLLLTLF
jgi:hypothetical protein